MNIYRTNGTCTNSKAVVSVYVRNKDGKALSKSSISGLNKSTYTEWKTKSEINHYHSASSLIPQ